MEMANKFSLETVTNEQLNSEDELEQIRRRRLEQMKSMAKVIFNYDWEEIIVFFFLFEGSNFGSAGSI
jgi:1,2-phenylacetyl-CoA epoxidase catalytic subunit